MRLVLAVLALAYPLLAHLASLLNRPALRTAAVAALAALVLLPLLRARPLAGAIATVVALVAAVALARHDRLDLLLFAPPVLIPAFGAWMFGHTLAPGRVPLIQQLVAMIHGDGPIDPGVPAYARRLTLAWAVVMATLAVANLVLALLATPGGLLLASGVQPPVAVPLAWWSWLANVGGYLLLAVLFVAEYAYRRRRFPDQPYRNFADFLMRVRAVGPRLAKSLRQ
ncbi:MAG TPA: ketosynthase [Xanthomonadales bacterium]|nr:ketosynthase [Xanthomonadales bacterium]